MAHDFAPVKSICAHLSAFHVYASDPTRSVEANHYCSQVAEDVRQCLIYDSADKGARLIGIEYMITPKLYSTLPSDERQLWHSHVFEVKSGMLVIPGFAEGPETAQMEAVIELYGKVYHLWQVDKGHAVPLGEPQLMTSVTAPGQIDFERLVGERDRRFGVDWKRKKEIRGHIEDPKIHPDADAAWKKNTTSK